MRKALVLLAMSLAVPLSVYADISVTYSQDSSERVCPANSYMIGSVCQCALGYVAKDNACVKPETAPAQTPTQYQIYQEILMSITINEKMTCAQLGWLTPSDADMCSRYMASTEKSKWVGIDRPRNAPMSIVLNPWAPPSQQTMSDTVASTTVAPKIIPKPVATSTPELPKPEVKPDDATLAENALAQLSTKLAKETPVPEPVPAKKPAPEPEPAPTEPPALDATPAQLAGAASAINDLVASSTDTASTTEEEGVKIYTGTLGLVPYGTPLDGEKQGEVPKQESFFGRIAAWFFSLF